LADCNSNCEAQCDAVVEADCNSQCGGCCSGSCESDANFDCSLSCTADLQGGCEVDCQRPEGALFCDGQYLAFDDIPACLAWLAENFEIEVEFKVEIEAEASVSGCSTSGSGSSNMAPVGALGLVALGAAVARRRRKA
jgi:MYXO-CTERM domain-containing protein